MSAGSAGTAEDGEMDEDDCDQRAEARKMGSRKMTTLCNGNFVVFMTILS